MEALVILQAQVLVRFLHQGILSKSFLQGLYELRSIILASAKDMDPASGRCQEP